MKSLNEYINESLLDELDDLETASDIAIENELIEKFLEENYSIFGKHTINNGIVDVKGSISIKNKKLTELTNGMFEFGEVSDIFKCLYCDSLTSLKGAPKKVGEFFDCSYCKSLTSLEGAPKEVGGAFDCSHCGKLKSLKGAPKEVGGAFDCSHCGKLKSLKGAPKEVGDSFYCSFCKKLTSLKGAPNVVKRNFICVYCTSLTDFKDAPKEIGGVISKSHCGGKEF